MPKLLLGVADKRVFAQTGGNTVSGRKTARQLQGPLTLGGGSFTTETAGNMAQAALRRSLVARLV
jgi:hypothetical protein